MNEIEEFRRSLGPVAKGYTDAQLPQLRRELYAMAELLLDIYLEKKKTSRRSPRTGVLTDTDRGDTMPG
jgi:hypothetical protein